LRRDSIRWQVARRRIVAIISGRNVDPDQFREAHPMIAEAVKERLVGAYLLLTIIG
jgi:hypothetical protein